MGLCRAQQLTGMRYRLSTLPPQPFQPPFSGLSSDCCILGTVLICCVLLLSTNIRILLPPLPLHADAPGTALHQHSDSSPPGPQTHRYTTPLSADFSGPSLCNTLTLMHSPRPFSSNSPRLPLVSLCRKFLCETTDCKTQKLCRCCHHYRYITRHSGSRVHQPLRYHKLLPPFKAHWLEQCSPAGLHGLSLEWGGRVSGVGSRSDGEGRPRRPSAVTSTLPLGSSTARHHHSPSSPSLLLPLRPDHCFTAHVSTLGVVVQRHEPQGRAVGRRGSVSVGGSVSREAID